MAADYDGIGRTNVAVYRPSTGIWYVLHGDGTYIAVQQGGSGDIPAVGDYNGDGKADFGVFRSGSSFCVLYTGGAQGCTTWGTVGDIPTIVPYAVLNAYFPGLFGVATQGAGSPGSCSTPTLDNAPVPMTWVGSGIGYTQFNYVPQEGTTVPLRKNGPISQYFANATIPATRTATFPNVFVDATNTGSKQQWTFGGASPEIVWMCVNGTASWKSYDQSIETMPNSCAPEALSCPAPPYTQVPRYHARLYQSPVPDSNGRYFTIADAHHDNANDHFTDDYINARGLLTNAFRKPDGTPISYVNYFGQLYNAADAANYQNNGQPVTYWDGKVDIAIYN